MILYFSATGNSKFVAQKIAEATNDNAVSMTEAGTKLHLSPKEPLGIITPTYHWGLPSYVEDFMEKVQIIGAENSYIYYVATYGTTTGQTETFMKQFLKKKKLSMHASYSVRMPDTWTPVFNLSNKEKVAKIHKKELPQIASIIHQVKKQEHGDFMKAKVPMFAVKLYRPSYEKTRSTSHLHVEDSCIGCGLCAKNCPVHAIEMKENKPVWVKDRCTMCLQCLHKCPKFAIQYDNKTKKHGQYVHP